MARQVYSKIGVDLAAKSPLATGSATVYQREHALGEKVFADSGIYIYGQANGATDEGAAAKYVEGAFDFDEVTTTESGSTHTPVGICVASGGLADNQYGWYWIGGWGQEEVYCADVNADVQLTTTATAGVLGSGGDNVFGLFTNENNAAEGLTTCRATGILVTNTTIAAT